jgi:hypothetical protein
LNLRPLPCEGNALPINPIKSTLVCRVRPVSTRFVRQFPGRKRGSAQTVPALSVTPKGTTSSLQATLLGRTFATAGLSGPQSSLVADKPHLIPSRDPQFLAALCQRLGIAAKALEVTLLTVCGPARSSAPDGAKSTSRTRFGLSRPSNSRTAKPGPSLTGCLSTQVTALLKALSRLGDHVFLGQKPGKSLSNMAMLGLLKDMNLDVSGKPRSPRQWVSPSEFRSRYCGPPSTRASGVRPGTLRSGPVLPSRFPASPSARGSFS